MNIDTNNFSEFKFEKLQVENIEKALNLENTRRKNVFFVGENVEKVIGDRKCFFCEIFIVGRDAVFEKKPNNEYLNKNRWTIFCKLFLSLGEINLKELEVNAFVIILANKVHITGFKKFSAKFFWAIGCKFKGGVYPIKAEKQKFSKPVIRSLKFIEKKYVSDFFSNPLFDVIDIEIIEIHEKHIDACIRTIKEALQQ